ncbi:MAG: hypothetical protein HYT79_01970 [Elusimicrobia bacterium]|nr:hypothetical protein [Elusimicrobiota bacterium]
MADEKEGHHSPSFTRLLRGAQGPESHAKDVPKSSTLHREPVKREEEKKRKPIVLPFSKGEGESGLFSIGYREWAFLFGSTLLLFGGMAAVRLFAPKEPSLTPAFEVAPTDMEEVTRPPEGSEPTDEIVTSAAGSRDTTRLVQPLSELVPKPKEDKSKAAGGPLDQTKESPFWAGLKEAEKQTGKPPRLPGMLGALNAALGGLGGASSAAPPVRIMSGDEIASRLRNLPAGSSRGGPGGRLSYSGAQNIPGMGGSGRRSRTTSSRDAVRKAREAARQALGALHGQPEQTAANAAGKFGESTGGRETNQGPGGGAVTSGDTPKQDKSEGPSIDYKIERDPIADHMRKALFDWELEKQKKRDNITDWLWAYDALGEGLKTIAQKGLAEPLANLVGGAVNALAGDAPPEPTQFVCRRGPRSTTCTTSTKEFLRGKVPLSDDELKTASIIGVEHMCGRDPCADPFGADAESCIPQVRVRYQASSTTEAKEKSTSTQWQESTFTLNGVRCSDIESVTGARRGEDDSAAAAPGAGPGGDSSTPTPPAVPPAPTAEAVVNNLRDIPEFRDRVTTATLNGKSPDELRDINDKALALAAMDCAAAPVPGDCESDRQAHIQELNRLLGL